MREWRGRIESLLIQYSSSVHASSLRRRMLEPTRPWRMESESESEGLSDARLDFVRPKFALRD